MPWAGVGVASWSLVIVRHGRHRTPGRCRCCLVSSWVVLHREADPKSGHGEVMWGVLAVNPQCAFSGGLVTLIRWVMMEVVGVCTSCIQYKTTTTKLSSSPVCIVWWPCRWLGARGFVHGSGALGHTGRRVHPLVAVVVCVGASRRLGGVVSVASCCCCCWRSQYVVGRLCCSWAVRVVCGGSGWVRWHGGDVVVRLMCVGVERCVAVVGGIGGVVVVG